MLILRSRRRHPKTSNGESGLPLHVSIACPPAGSCIAAKHQKNLAVRAYSITDIVQLCGFRWRRDVWIGLAEAFRSQNSAQFLKVSPPGQPWNEAAKCFRLRSCYRFLANSKFHPLLLSRKSINPSMSWMLCRNLRTSHRKSKIRLAETV